MRATGSIRNRSAYTGTCRFLRRGSGVPHPFANSFVIHAAERTPWEEDAVQRRGWRCVYFRAFDMERRLFPLVPLAGGAGFGWDAPPITIVRNGA